MRYGLRCTPSCQQKRNLFASPNMHKYSFVEEYFVDWYFSILIFYYFAKNWYKSKMYPVIKGAKIC